VSDSVAERGEFRNHYPAYHADIAGETRKALGELRITTMAGRWVGAEGGRMTAIRNGD
jgi:hypothetical protein